MGTFSIWHWLIVLAVVLLLFGGRGKISGLMGDFGKGLKSFKKGMKDDEDEIASEEEPKVLKSESVATPAPEVATPEPEKDRAAEG
jgi:sec-independent protein translocase protein TatA